MCYTPRSIPTASYPPPLRAPRISGTAMPTGVFLSTGSASTSSGLHLFATGFTIVSLGIITLVPTYVIVWIVEQFLEPMQLQLVPLFLHVGGPADPLLWAAGRIFLNVLTFFVFLIILRMSPLAGYHAAEHMTVHAIERFGVFGWEPYVGHMRRAHLRCGSNLMAGILPGMLIAVPLMTIAPLAAAAVAAAGWIVRHYTGFFLQNVFTTKPPTPHQLRKGIEAGRELLAAWMKDPDPRRTLARSIWERGMPQMVGGVVCAMYVLAAIGGRLALWLDW